MDMICKTLDLIWRLQNLASIQSGIDRLDSTHNVTFGYDFTLPETCHSRCSTTDPVLPIALFIRMTENRSLLVAKLHSTG